MKLSSRYLPYIALAAAAAIWGANTPIMKYTLEHVPLFTLAFLRFFVAAIILYPFVAKHLSYQKKDLFPLFLSAFLGITVIITLFFTGLRFTTALNTGVIHGTVPIFLMIFGYIFLREKVTKKMIIGAALGFLGLCIIIGKDMLLEGFDVSPLGDTLIILSNIAFAAYATLSKELSHKYTPIAITFFLFLIGSLFFIPGVIFEYQTNPQWFYNMPLAAYGGILYGVVFAGIIAFLLWQYGLSKVSETQVGFFLYISPVVTTLIAISVLGEQLTDEFLIGALLIVIGLIVAEAHLRHKHHHVH